MLLIKNDSPRSVWGQKIIIKGLYISLEGQIHRGMLRKKAFTFALKDRTHMLPHPLS